MYGDWREGCKILGFVRFGSRRLGHSMGARWRVMVYPYF